MKKILKVFMHQEDWDKLTQDLKLIVAGGPPTEPDSYLYGEDTQRWRKLADIWKPRVSMDEWNVGGHRVVRAARQAKAKAN